LWPSLVKVLEVLIHPPPPLRRHPFPTGARQIVALGKITMSITFDYVHNTRT
jgi:hypothetical protein